MASTGERLRRAVIDAFTKDAIFFTRSWESVTLFAALALIAAFSVVFIREAAAESTLPPCRSGNFTRGTCEPDETGVF